MRLSLRLAALAAITMVGPVEAQNLASPRDTTRASFGGATVLIDYGRPSMRGRTIFGGLVPWDQVWRTGANSATTLVTDKPLMIGSAMVPAGTYTLYTVPGEKAWKLVVNKQTGQWGTTYQAAADLVRIDMKVEPVAAPVEMFTIELVPSGNQATLRLVWDRTAAVVPVMVH
ncbi:MAG: DUF2911 domain-containing protein [Gemmatimonadales bacterium]